MDEIGAEDVSNLGGGGAGAGMVGDQPNIENQNYINGGALGNLYPVEKKQVKIFADNASEASKKVQKPKK